MAKITSVKINGFRGIRNQINFDFGKNIKNLVLSGENGKGKSSLTDAIEWYFQDNVDHLRKEGCQINAYRHYRLPDSEDAIVSINTTDKTICGAKHLQITRDSNGEERHRTIWRGNGINLNTFLETSKGESIILRHAQLKDFVNQTKTKKLIAVSSIIGFDVVTQTRDTLIGAKGNIERNIEYRKIIGQVAEKVRDIESIIVPVLGPITNLPSDILKAAEELRHQVNGKTMISDISTFQQAVTEINNESINNQHSTKLQELLGIESRLQQIILPSDLILQIKTYFAGYKDLFNKKESLEKLALMDLYIAANDILKNKPTLDKCPVCNGKISNEELQIELQSRIKEFAEIKNDQQVLQTSADSLKVSINSIKTTIQSALNDIEKKSMGARISWTQSVHQILIFFDAISEYIQKSLKFTDIEEPNPIDYELLENYIKETNEYIELIKSEFVKSSDSEDEKQRNIRIQSLNLLLEHNIRWIELNTIEGQFKHQITSLTNIISHLEQRERLEFNNMLSAISDKVNGFYLSLHPKEGFDELKLLPTQDRGLEFEFSFKGDRITPPSRFMSESHLNTLGLCFFLASAVEFNKNCEFLILDDVVSSVDANHRLSLARLLRDDPHLNKIQFIILSHDMFWSDILRRTFPNWQHKKILSWDYDTGISIDEVQEIQTQIDHAINLGGTINAARRTRDLVDIKFREICEEYNIPLPYKQGDDNEKRDLKTFIIAVKQYFGRNNRFDASTPPLKDIEDCLWLMNIASHPDPRQLNLVMNDVTIVLNDLEKFIQFFYCHLPNCSNQAKKLIWNNKLDSFEICKICNKPF